MLRQLNRLIYAEFFYFFFSIFFALLFLGSAYRITTLSESDKIYLSAIRIMLSFIYSLPFICTIVIPVSYLFALYFTFNKLTSSGELMGIYTSRVSSKRIAKITFLLTIILVTLSLLNSHLIKPLAERKMLKLFNMRLLDYMKELKAGTINNLDNNKYIFFEQSMDSRSFSKVLYLNLSPETNSLKAISSERMILSEPYMVSFEKGVSFEIKNQNFTSFEFFNLMMPVTGEKEVKISPQLLPTRALFLISLYSPDSPKEAVELFERFLLPLSPLIFFLYLLPISTSLKKNQLNIFLKYLFICILFFATAMLCRSLGKKVIINPFLLYPAVIISQILAGILFFKRFIRYSG